MAKPRRAARRRVNGRVLISSCLIGVTAIATFAVWQMSDTEASVALPAAEESAVIETASTPSLSPDPVSTPSAPSTEASTRPSAAPKTAPGASAVDWAGVVADCKATVRSRDTVISRAATGIDHWSQHVQAQTDANAGKISVATMKKSFMRTRLLGPSDIARYRDALDSAANNSAGCSTPKAAPADVAAALRPCASRLSAQRPLLTAGARGMGDWSSHLAAMRRNKESHVHNAQQVWVRAWRAAPAHIEAFDNASAKFRAAAGC
jgi:hypothetical protein